MRNRLYQTVTVPSADHRVVKPVPFIFAAEGWAADGSAHFSICSVSSKVLRCGLIIRLYDKEVQETGQPLRVTTHDTLHCFKQSTPLRSY